MDMHAVDGGQGAPVRRVHKRDHLLDEIDVRDLNLRVIFDHRVENPGRRTGSDDDEVIRFHSIARRAKGKLRDMKMPLPRLRGKEKG
jgi:hypothetical protein